MKGLRPTMVETARRSAAGELREDLDAGRVRKDQDDSGPLFPPPMPYPPLYKAPGPTTPAPDMPSIASQNSTQQLPGVNSPAVVTRQLPFNASPAVTRLLPDLQTSTHREEDRAWDPSK